MAADKGPSLIEVSDASLQEAIAALRFLREAAALNASPSSLPNLGPALLRAERAAAALTKELDPRSYK